MSAADEAQQVKLAAAEEAQRLKGEVQNLQIQYQNTTNLHRETHVRTDPGSNLAIAAALLGGFQNVLYLPCTYLLLGCLSMAAFLASLFIQRSIFLPWLAGVGINSQSTVPTVVCSCLDLASAAGIRILVAFTCI